LSSEVFIAGVGITPLGKHPDKSVKDLAAIAVRAALADAGCEASSVQAAWFCNTRWGIFEGQHGIRGQVALRPLGLQGIPIFNTDNACASSTAGLSLARAWIGAGAADIALVVGADKMHYEGRRADMFQAFKGSMDVELAQSQLERLVEQSRKLPAPEGVATERSIFMDSYAAYARLHMARYGTTPLQLALVAEKNHWNSQFNPNAQYRKPMSAEQVLADKLISWPLTRSMCAPMSDGAGAVLLCSRSALDKFDRKRAIRILSCQVMTGIPRDIDDSENQVGRLAALRAYDEAGIGPQDLSVAEVHDASAFGELKQIENIGLCPIGESGPFTEQGHTRLSGKIPVNTSGGLISKGHPVGATGAIQIHELVTQLRGEAGPRQVPGARLAAAENGGGFYDGEEAVAAVTLLSRGLP
jgi:acetyl-CoA acyltransferase